ncbi:hypothetical protein [Micromonospora sp. B9E7]|uniref:hypothetical protein n=1 Tax=Micromonospora sp. B9E7 TaxID=3153574 RepID=UPI00325F4D2C
MQRPGRVPTIALTVVATLGLIAATGWWAVTSYVDAFVYPGGPCSDVEARLTDELRFDPMLVQAFPDSKLQTADSFEPCRGWGSNYWGGAFVTRSHTKTPPPGDTSVEGFYASLGNANGWHMTLDGTSRSVCGKKSFGDQVVTFNLEFQRSSPTISTGYTASLLYAGQRQPVNECSE